MSGLADLIERSGAARLVVLDVETTGLGSEDRVAEIAMVALAPDGSRLARFESLVDPQQPMNPHASRVNGLDGAMLAGSPTFAELAGDVAAFLSGACLVAHNATFDVRMLAAEFARVGSRLSPGQPIDTYRATGVRLEVALRRHGIQSGTLHRAMDDVEATADLLLRVAGDLTPGRALEIIPSPRPLGTPLRPRTAVGRAATRAESGSTSTGGRPASGRTAVRAIRPTGVVGKRSGQGEVAMSGRDGRKESVVGDVSEKVELIVAGGFEGATVTGLFVEAGEPDDDGEALVEVRGELEGLAVLPEDAVLSCIINDGDGRVVAKSDHLILEDSYVGFEVFEFTHYARLSGGVGRIRLVLKAL